MSATCLEGLAMLLPGSRRDSDEGLAPTQKSSGWFTWGYVKSRSGDVISWYILLRLPSYLMKQRFGFPWSVDEPVWHQRCLLFREKIPAGWGGWDWVELECDDDVVRKLTPVAERPTIRRDN